MKSGWPGRLASGTRGTLGGEFERRIYAGFCRGNHWHADPHVRLWTVRLLGDERVLTEPLAKRLARLAKREPHVEVRSQLAAMAKRLPAPRHCQSFGR